MCYSSSATRCVYAPETPRSFYTLPRACYFFSLTSNPLRNPEACPSVYTSCFPSIYGIGTSPIYIIRTNVSVNPSYLSICCSSCCWCCCQVCGISMIDVFCVHPHPRSCRLCFNIVYSSSTRLAALDCCYPYEQQAMALDLKQCKQLVKELVNFVGHSIPMPLPKGI